jgi:hypothetical protein
MEHGGKQMNDKTLPLRELSIHELFNGDEATFEVPIYQRNYAWEKDEISALVQDVYDACEDNKDACEDNKSAYFIGTLVTFHKGGQVYEVIDGQQRLTTINLILKALGIAAIQNRLTYRARKKSNDTIRSIPEFKIDERDNGIIAGYRYAEESIREIVPDGKLDEFKKYFQSNVHIIHYQVPEDIDLNHYFEIMNSRGEQLEMHEIIKARLIEKLGENDKEKFNRLWENCGEMGVYIQQKYSKDKEAAGIFGDQPDGFKIECFEKLPPVDSSDAGTRKINDMIKNIASEKQEGEADKIDAFQPIIDFPNFLLIVLKLTLIGDASFKLTSSSSDDDDKKLVRLDDKELIREFGKVNINTEFVKRFGFNLLKAKYLLDNYIVHHSNEKDTIGSNPWKLQHWQNQNDEKKSSLKNLAADDSDTQDKLVQLLSMFEVSFTAKQRKNYLFYCLSYLFNDKNRDVNAYCEFVSKLAEKYFRDVYLSPDNPNENNTPKPGAFDKTILKGNIPNVEIDNKDCGNSNSEEIFGEIYGNGTSASKGIPLFIFNYLDYKLWKKYFDELRGEGKDNNYDFEKNFGCSSLERKDLFEHFYFSRTRRSLEHYFPQANVKDDNAPSEAQINCFGNYAMIGSEINSSGSNWNPKDKLGRYLDTSRKIRQVSVASIKFMIMMQKCMDNDKAMDNDNKKKRVPATEWIFEDIEEHQKKMLEILFS